MTDAFARLAAALADRYRIERELGEGGMATVYLAEDLKHDRQVAIKVLKPELAAVLGADRFVQEIKTTASLQHPNILPLFDSGTAGGFLYYVMPYVEGESLRDRLNREKQLPVQEAVDLTSEVADALEYAHEHGVVHRDIKPENILIHAGRPMVADFGIALAVSAAAGGRMTETGLSVGTPHYMSPEQATAEPDITGRSDIYSLASVLYEMLTGDPPHVGSSAQQIIMKIVTEEAAPVTKLRKSVPANVAAAVGKGLEKLPADRFESAKAFADALHDEHFSTTAAGATGAAGGAGTRWRTIAFAVAALAVALAATTVWGWLRTTPQPAVARFDIRVAGGGPPRAIANGAVLAIAPDGSRFVYVGDDSALYLRNLGQLTSTALPARGWTPFFSPDGRWVAYVDRDTLKKVPLSGGPPLAIAPGFGDLFRGGSWGEDGTIVFAPSIDGPLFAIADGGGPVDTLTHLDAAHGVTSDRWPEWLPGQKGVLFEACKGAPDRCTVAVLDRRTDSVRDLTPGLSPHYVAPGYLVYTSPSGTLLAAPFDLDRLEMTGKPVSLMQGILVRASWNGEFAVARNGTLLYLSGGETGWDLTLVDTTGRARVLLPNVVDLQTPRLSPDRRQVAFWATSTGLGQIWIYDRTLKTVSRLTFKGAAGYPAWSPSGDTVYYKGTTKDGTEGIWRQAADGSGAPEQVLTPVRPLFDIAIPTSGGLALVSRRDSTVNSLYTVPLTPKGQPRPWVADGFSNKAPSFSPDGRWAAYTSDESGMLKIYVRAFPNAGRRWQVSSGGGTEPLWSRDGRAIYYRRADTIFAVAVQTRPTFSVGRRRMVFTASFLGAVYDLTTNYTRDPRTGDFIMVSETRGNSAHLVVVLNWFQVLKQQMAGGG